MNQFIKFGENYVNPRFIKQAKFNDNECSLIIANTQTVSTGSSFWFRENDEQLTIHDKKICEKVKERFEKYYKTSDY